MKVKLRKILLCMSKIAVFAIGLHYSFFTFALSANVEAQQKMLLSEINIAVSKGEKALIASFVEIEKNSGFVFAYTSKEVKNKTVNINKSNWSMDELLKEISMQTNLSFKRVNETITVRQIDKKENLPSVIDSIVQTRNVTGKVTSQEDGESLPGVNVVERGTSNGTITDINGSYAITVNEGAVLVFSSVGYILEEISVGNRATVDLIMNTDIRQLQELVVVGYGAVAKSDLTGAVSSVREDELTAYPANSAIQALQGRAAGVTIQSINGGEPGGGYRIRIRGGTSINASSEPLYVVDGLVGGQLPPPEDIASIEILKDASASAIYGSRGANGVVMITTKSGRPGQIRVNLNSSYSTQHEIGRLEMLNARQFAEYINEARNSNFFDLNSIDMDTDWQDLIFRPGNINNHQLAVSGGGDVATYYVSGTYFGQDGIIKTSAYERYSLTSNLKFKVSPRVRVNVNSMLWSSNRDGVRTQSGGGALGAGVISSALRFDPNQGIIDSDGRYSTSKVGIAAFENPMAVIDGRTDESRQENIQLNTKAEIDLLKGMVFNSTLGTIIRTSRDGSYDSRISNLGENNLGLANMGYQRNFNFLTEHYLNYNFKVGSKNNFVLTGGYSYQRFTTESFSTSSSGFITDALDYWNLGVGTILRAPSSNYTESEIVSYYARMNYNFDDRYLLTFTGRYDGASQFSKGNKWSFFPSGAFSWNISNEAFYPQNDVLSNFKARTSYGLTGNQAIGPYRSLAEISSTFFVVNNASVSSVRPSSIANRDLTWETTSQFNAGLDLEFFDNRINLTGDYYYKKTSDLLFNVPVAAFSGYSNRLENLGEIENKGFEFQITSRNLVGTFNWTTGFNLTMNRNRVLALPDGLDIIYSSVPTFTGSLQNSILREGAPVGSFYGYVYEGVYQEGDEFIPGSTFETSPGGEKFSDLNKDGVLNSEDRMIIGNPNPKAVWGLNNDFSIKGITVNLFFQAFTGNDMLNLVKMELDRLSGNSNATTDALRRWTSENTNTNVPKAFAGRTPRTSTRFVEDGSFVRLKNVSVGYEFNPEILRKLRINTARLYISGQNLFTLTKYSGVDPEVAFRSSNVNLGLDYDSYPNTVSYTIGLNLGF